ncbi:type II toxin-antitoxin system HicA family toxin [Veillonella criceti]|uniref:type II toxin-antitoxin system HicA family toxin n=1 Tax=Veillonella criceti TaxID=103891 RepID=UPI000E1B8CB1|nr:type II toxin-antitoxin system HicA family toxin [Veillonella criceti]
MTPKELIKILKRDGWVLVRTRESHYIFKHEVKRGLVTVPFHSKDLKPKTLQSIISQAMIKED